MKFIIILFIGSLFSQVSQEFKYDSVFNKINIDSVYLSSKVYMRIFKESKELEVWLDNKLYKKYEICSHSGKLGPKIRGGDHQSPEGFYKVWFSDLNMFSEYHFSIDINYPNEYDKSYGYYSNGIIAIHGDCISAGCFAVGNKIIEEIFILFYNSLKNKIQQTIDVHIFPFRMTNENMKKYENSKWINFWRNLKPAYDVFEATQIVPEISIKNGKYVIENQYYLYLIKYF